MDDNLEFADICRICLSRNNHKLIQEVEYLIDLFRNITNIQIDSFDELPQNICNECIEKLVSISNFIALSKQNDALLRRSFQNKILIKTELDLNADDARNIEHQETDQKLNSEIYIKTEPDLVNQYENECDLDFQITEPELCKSERELMEDVDSSDEVNFIEKKQTKRLYNNWKQEDMDEAVCKHRNGEIGLNEASRLYKIPKPTLLRHLKGANKKSNGIKVKMEDELAQHVIDLQSNFFGLTTTELRQLAFQFAEKHNLPHRFKNKIAGRHWFYRFMKERPGLALRVPEARRKGFYKERVNEFFYKYEQLLDEHKFTADRIYNMDNTILSTSGYKGLTTSASTCVFAMNAAGQFIPPMLIFRGTRIKNFLKKGAPPNTAYGCSKDGGITSELFVQWLEHFVKFAGLEKSDDKKNQTRTLLLLDGHSSHTKHLKAFQLSRDYGIIALSFPAHTKYDLQPLERSFFPSLTNCYSDAACSWLRSNPGEINQANVAELLGNAYLKSVRTDVAVNGFAATRLWPYDRNVGKGEEEVYIAEQSEATRIVTSLGVQSGPSTIPQGTAHEGTITAEEINDPELKISLNDLSPNPCITSVIEKVKIGTNPTTELTAKPCKDEVEAKEKFTKRKKPVLNLSETKRKKGM